MSWLNDMANAVKRGELIAQAEEQLATKYPQYREHWDEWVLCRVKRTIKTKLGVAFEAGDIVLVQPLIRDLSDASYAKRQSKLGVTCYSFRNQCDTGIWLDEIECDTTGWRTVKES